MEWSSAAYAFGNVFLLAGRVKEQGVTDVVQAYRVKLDTWSILSCTLPETDMATSSLYVPSLESVLIFGKNLEHTYKFDMVK